VLPGKAAKQNRDTIPLFGGKRPLNRTMKMCGLVKTSDLAQPAAFSLQALLDFLVIVDLHEISCHYLSSGTCGVLNLLRKVCN
jgi:hypothetical protein